MRKSKIVIGMTKEKIRGLKKSIKRTLRPRYDVTNSTWAKTEFAKSYLDYCSKNGKPLNSKELTHILRALD